MGSKQSYSHQRLLSLFRDASFLCLLLIWPLGQLTSFHILGVRANLLDIAVLCYLIFNGVRLDKIWFVIVAFSISMLANFQGSSLPAYLYLVRFILYLCLVVAVEIKQIVRYRLQVFASATIFVSLGLYQYLAFPDVRQLQYLGFDDHYYRLIGTLFDPNFTGLVIVFLLLATLTQNRFSKLFSICLLLTLALTFSRSAYISLVFGLIAFTIFTRKFKILLLLLVLTFMILLVPKPFGEGVNLLRTFSISSRLTNQFAAWQTFSTHPIFGIGFNNYKVAKVSDRPILTSGVDNSFLFTLATTGILGFSAMVHFLIRLYRSLTLSGKLILATMIFGSLFNNALYLNWNLVLLGFTVSVSKIKASA